MKTFLFDVAVLLGRLFMAFLLIAMIVIAIPLGILVSFLALTDDIVQRRVKRTTNEFID